MRPNTNRPCPQGRHHATQGIYRDVDGSHFFHRKVDTRIARRSAGCMIFHPQHNHWHFHWNFKAASRYTLSQPNEERRLVGVARRKMSFCLRDSRRIPREYGTSHQPEFYGARSKYSPKGISVGWVDVYQSFPTSTSPSRRLPVLPGGYQSFPAGQALRLPRNARDGLYCLQNKVDPKDQLVETNDRDNTSMRAFTLQGDRTRIRRASRCE